MPSFLNFGQKLRGRSIYWLFDTLGRLIPWILTNPRHIARRSWQILKYEGVKAFIQAIHRSLATGLQDGQANFTYLHWVARYDTLTDKDRRSIRQHIARLPYRPLISVIMPTYNTPEQYLRRAIESVRSQLYPYWELCIADDASEKPHVHRILEEYRAIDERIKVVYREKRGHISEASNSALALATGEFIAFLDHDDELPEHALYMVVVELNDHPEADLIYSDEDKINEKGKRFGPYFKPDWNYDLLLGQNYLAHLAVYRTALVREIGGLRKGYEGAQDWDLALRVVEKIPSSHIRHIPHILYHWRTIPGSAALGIHEKPYVREAQYKALRTHFERIGQDVEILPVQEIFWRIRYLLPQPFPFVSLIIPTRNRLDLLHRCLESILQKTTYPNYEIVLVDNQSDDPETLSYLINIGKEARVRVLRYDAPFNYAAINNFAASYAKGEVLGFLHDDVEIITPNWLEEIVSHALRSEVGAVGAMLYYPDETIQHAGVILGLGGLAGYAYRYFPKGYPGHGGRAWLTQSLSAVTGACLFLRKTIFEEVQGFDEAFAVAFNDVDLCLRIRERGYKIIWTPFAELCHHEGASRGRDTVENPRFQRESALLRKRWEEALLYDPAYNPNLTLNREDFSFAFPPRIQKPWKGRT